ncbi:helix-turn-helix transcriptional regulator [Streptosporangium sp. 'caverna']|uniref:helix-turn-helix transcriptional regulator n=1 Tax=Streptosporangium sp. 'caverna' TaxID=2202249 RepID=UPI000D7DF9C5|nr:helix-turn-helix transcriptional regulator [Streptosporangium sp. 'caverna']AWS43569.1 transcriptional regulator [Streptosporangium sp. 'caverna']
MASRCLGMPVLPWIDDHFVGAAAVTGTRNVALGAFLRTRRAQVEPHDVGLPTADRRRVPGLRREEIAQLAGVSPDYYTRLEQGRQRTASRAVLDGVAGALRLTADERSHLYTLAGIADADGTSPGAPARRTVDRKVQRVLDLLGDTPAILFGPFIDVITANRAASFLFADFNVMPARERNGLRWMLLSSAARELYGRSWEDAATEMIGMLRIDAGRTPDHPRLAELVAELNDESALFNRLWREHRVSTWLHERKILRHPGFGDMEFFNELITLHSAPGQTLVVMIPADPVAFRKALRA